MKIDSKLILPLFEDFKALIESLQDSFREFEDLDQAEDCMLTCFKDMKDLMVTFKIKHLLPVAKQSLGQSLPQFMKSYDSLVDKIHDLKKTEVGVCLTDYEERIQFMGRFYLAMKRKLIIDNVDHLYTEDKIRDHIETYLVGNDDEWSRYFQTELATSVYKVIDSLVEGIMDQRKKNPQFILDLKVSTQEKSSKLIDNL